MTEQAAEATNWIPGAVVLGAGVVAGLGFLLTNKTIRNEAPAPETLDDLNARYDSVIAQLKDHQGQKSKQPPADWEKEKSRLEHLAASMLKQRAEKKHEAVKAEARAEKRAAQAATAPQGMNPTLKGALLGGAVVAVFVLLGVKLTENTNTRGENQSITGGMMGGAGPMQGGGEAQGEGQGPVDPRVEELFQLTQQHPDDVEAMNALATYMLERQAFDEARTWVNRAISLDPWNVKARVNATVLGAVEGKEADTATELERLGATYPEAWDGHLFAGMIAMDLQDRPRAIKNFQAWLVQAPPSERVPGLEAAVKDVIREGANPSPAKAPPFAGQPPGKP